MWIEELPNGKYKYSERYIDPYTEKKQKSFDYSQQQVKSSKKTSND